MYTGKPVAVTHSKGIGKPELAPSSHANRRAYEKNYYINREFRKKKVHNREIFKEEEEVTETEQDQATLNEDEFYSMSEIASCSYEARKVFIT